MDISPGLEGIKSCCQLDGMHSHSKCLTIMGSSPLKVFEVFKLVKFESSCLFQLNIPNGEGLF